MGVLRSILHIATLGIVDSNEEVARKNTPFVFPYNISESDFSNIAISVAKPIKRLCVSVDNQFVRGTVRTSSGINTWEFTIDFNDYGTLTGNYWMRYVENSDSQIPYNYAKQLSSAIVDYLHSNQ
jgi:hypothetical protein